MSADPVDAAMTALRRHVLDDEDRCCGRTWRSYAEHQRHQVEEVIAAARPLIIATYQRETTALRALMDCEQTGHGYALGVGVDGRCERGCGTHILDDPTIQTKARR